MGHRALVAYARGDGRYDIHYAHWGAADLSLADRLTTPAGDPVDPDPVATGVPFAAVVREHVVPPVHEALFVVDADAVRTYRVLWFGPLGVEGGLLVAVDPGACDDDAVLAWFRGARALAAACRERAGAPADWAATTLERRLRDWAGTREVLRCPAG